MRQEKADQNHVDWSCSGHHQLLLWVHQLNTYKYSCLDCDGNPYHGDIKAMSYCEAKQKLLAEIGQGTFMYMVIK